MELLERASQLKALETALGNVASGEGSIALVYGEAGIGKTSLVGQFTSEKRRSWRILLGTCDSLFTPRPLGPLLDIAMQTRGRLLELLESEANRALIFSACLNELKEEPSILVVEDVHWADEATLDLLKFLGRRVRQTRALMLLTYRDDEVGPDHPLRLLLGDIASSQVLLRIPVFPLSRGAVRQLARNRNVDGEELHRLTNGNPFYVTEVLAGEGGIPETVRDTVLARAIQLSTPARSALEAAAVIGLRAEGHILVRVAGEDAAGIRECVSKGMLQARGEYYAFRHELARQTLLEAIPSERKVELHRRTLAALNEAPETRRDLTRLASHAVGTGDANAVLEYAPAAARQASAVSAHREAAALYELALRFATNHSITDHAGLLESYSDEVFFQGRHAERLGLLQQAVELRRSLADHLQEGADLALLAGAHYLVGHTSEAESVGQASVAVLEALPPSAKLAGAYMIVCYIYMENRDRERATYWGEKAIGLAEAFHDAEVLARVHNYMGFATIMHDYRRGRTLLERCLSIAREAKLPFAVAGALENLGSALLEVLELDDAEHFLAEGLAYAADHDDDYHRQEALGAQVGVHFYRGHWQEAQDIAQQVLEGPQLDLETRTYALIDLARVGVRRGGQNAFSLLTEAIKLSEQAAALPRLGPARAAWAEAQWLSGATSRVLAGTEAAYQLAVSREHPWLAGELAFWRWRAGEVFDLPGWIAKPYALQIAGDWQGAASEWAQRGCPYEQAMALMDGGEAAQLKALEIFERLGAVPIIDKLRRKMRAEGVRGIPRGPRPSTRGNRFGLTGREMEVLACLVKGSSNPVIARELSLSARTVEHHIGAMLQKTGVQSRSELMALALKENLVVLK